MGMAPACRSTGHVVQIIDSFDVKGNQFAAFDNAQVSAQVVGDRDINQTGVNPLDREALRQILTEPKNSIVNQYIKLFKIDGIDIKFEDEALDYIVDQAISFKLGARGLRSICESIMLEAMFEMPSENKKTFTVTKEYAESKLDKTAAIKFRNA